MRSLVYAFIVLAACKVPDKAAPDDGGAIDAPPDTVIDPTPLDTIIDSGPADFSNQGQVTFQFSATKTNVTFECRIDAEAQAKCTSPYVRTLSDGSHEFSVRATDTSGTSDDTPAERVWTIDTIPPRTTLTSGPPHADNSTTAVFEFTSNEMNVTFECSLDGAGFLPCTSGESFGPIVDGPHSFTVRALDRAGNRDLSPAVWSWTVDTSTPDTQILTGPTGSVPVTTATFTFDSPDAGAGATFQCSLDGSAFAVCTSPHDLIVAEGSHTFEVRVRDVVGNLDPSPATRTWIVDLTAPDTTILTGPSGTVPVASASFTFDASELDVTFACSLDGAPFAACTSPFVAIGLAQGAHTFAVRATDMAGHDDPSPATASWIVDTIAPDIQITGGPDNGSTSGPRVTFSFTASDGAPTCSFDGAAFGPCTSPVATNLPATVHLFSVRATDVAGNVTTVTRAWTVACAGPDPTGAAGALHLDDTGQTLANAVPGGAPATLGDTVDVEPADPTPVAQGRFGGALAFDAASNEHVSWPTAVAAMSALTVEMWAAPGGAGAIFVSGDGRVAVTAAMSSPTKVKFSATLGDVPGPATSAAVAIGVWHHVLVSFQVPALHLWVDGVRTDVTNIQLVAPYAFDSVRLGGNASSSYTGMLDEIWFAPTAITTDEDALTRYCPL